MKGDSHDEFIKNMVEATQISNLTKKKMLLSKGDLLLWHPYLIHGAFSCENEAQSRKSFTSHFYSSQYKARGSDFKLRKTINSNIKVISKCNDYIYNAWIYIKFFKHKVFSIEKISPMNRKEYDEFGGIGKEKKEGTL